MRRSSPAANVEPPLVRSMTMELAEAVVLAADSRWKEPWPNRGLAGTPAGLGRPHAGAFRQFRTGNHPFFRVTR